jgi:hypothetical protein
MSKYLDFKKLERKAYLSYHQDGLIDIIIGIAILGFGLNIATDTVIFGILTWLPVIFYVPLKNYFTAPRFGYVRFSSPRQTTIRLGLALLVGLLAMLFFAGLYIFAVSGSIPPQINAWLRRYHMLIFAFVGMGLFLGAGIWTGIKRFYLYVVLTLIFPVVGIWLDIHPGIYVIALGITILIIGIWLLLRFIRDNPKVESVAVNELE